MIGSAFNFVQTDISLHDLEDWTNVLLVMSDAQEDVTPRAIAMVAYAMKRSLSELRVATGTGPASSEGR